MELQGCLNGLSIITIIITTTLCVPPADGFQEMMEPVLQRAVLVARCAAGHSGKGLGSRQL